MKEKLDLIKAEALKQINESGALDRLNEIKVNYLGNRITSYNVCYTKLLRRIQNAEFDL